MSTTWFTADYHLGEDRFEIMGRPFKSQMEMIDTLVNNHNSVVAPEDTVFIVGDVCYNKAPEYLPHIARFNGKKILIRGNHDRVFSDKTLSPYFVEIYTEGHQHFELINGINCSVTHYPSRGVPFAFNLVGHIHSAWKYQLNMLNVGVDVHHFFPVNADKLEFHLKAIEQYYDEDVWVAYNYANTKFIGKRGKPGSYFS